MIWAAAAGVLFGLFQAANRGVNQRVDAYSGTFRVLLSATALLVLATFTRDLSAASEAEMASWLAFAAAGILHFFVGWTLLALSQQRIGAARTGAALAATPVVGALLAALTLGERIGVVGYAAVALVSIGVALLATRHQESGARFSQVPWLALGAAACWGTSPIFIRWGLEGLPDPIVGVTVGVTAASLLYAGTLGLGLLPTKKAAKGVASWTFIAAVFVAAALAAQWISFEQIDVGVAIALMQLAAPVVVITAPFVIGGESERITGRLVAGMVAILSGSVMATLS